MHVHNKEYKVWLVCAVYGHLVSVTTFGVMYVSSIFIMVTMTFVYIQLSHTEGGNNLAQPYGLTESL